MLNVGLRLQLLLSLLALPASIQADLAADAKILEKCLRELSTPQSIASDLQALEHYADWENEELPCMMRCLAHEKGWFDIDANKWHKQRLVDDLGADVYNYCRFELQRKQHDGCSYAHRGLRCLKQAESQTITSYTTLLQCARKLNATNEELLQYSKLKPKEAIPCLFECFAEANHFYDAAGSWQLANWEQAFGPSRYEGNRDFSECRQSEEQRRQVANKCVWMYTEYRCWERLNDNLIEEPTTMASTTASSTDDTTSSTTTMSN